MLQCHQGGIAQWRCPTLARNPNLDPIGPARGEVLHRFAINDLALELAAALLRVALNGSSKRRSHSLGVPKHDGEMSTHKS